MSRLEHQPEPLEDNHDDTALNLKLFESSTTTNDRTQTDTSRSTETSAGAAALLQRCDVILLASAPPPRRDGNTGSDAAPPPAPVVPPRPGADAPPAPITDGRKPGTDAPPAPEVDKPVPAKTIMDNQLTNQHVPPNLSGKYNRVFQSAITDATHLKQETVNDIYKAAGINPTGFVPDSVKTQKLAEHFKMPANSTRKEVHDRLQQEAKAKLGVPPEYGPYEEGRLLQQKAFLKKLGLPETATRKQQLEALQKLP